MTPALWLAAYLLCVAGFGWLALAMEVHWRQASAAPLPSRPRRKLLQGLGVTALAGSLAACLAADHVSMAPLVWLMLLAAAALTVALGLSWRPRWLRPLVAWMPAR